MPPAALRARRGTGFAVPAFESQSQLDCVADQRPCSLPVSEPSYSLADCLCKQRLVRVLLKGTLVPEQYGTLDASLHTPHLYVVAATRDAYLGSLMGSNSIMRPCIAELGLSKTST